MSKTKLTPQQKDYIQSLDSEKKRKKQKKAFKLANLIDSKFKVTISVIEPIDMNFELDQSQPIEKPSLTKEILREVTEPKVKEHEIDGVTHFFIKPSIVGYNERPKMTDKDFLKEVTNMSKLFNPKLVDELLKYDPKEKLYTHEDMRNCFAESRLTHPMIGFKHDSFASYLNSIE